MATTSVHPWALRDGHTIMPTDFVPGGAPLAVPVRARYDHAEARAEAGLTPAGEASMRAASAAAQAAMHARVQARVAHLMARGRGRAGAQAGVPPASKPVTTTVEGYSLSDDDIRRILGPGCKIIHYPQLAGLTLDTLFGTDGTVVILFETEAVNQGHWICMLSHPNEVEVFDPYGKAIDTEREWLSSGKLAKLGETQPLIHQILEGFGGRITHNTRKLQEDASGVNTCGRHSAVRCLNRRIRLPAYIAKLRSTGETPDVYVTRVTQAIIGR